MEIIPGGTERQVLAENRCLPNRDDLLYGYMPLPKPTIAWIERVLLVILPLAKPFAFMATFIIWPRPLAA